MLARREKGMYLWSADKWHDGMAKRANAISRRIGACLARSMYRSIVGFNFQKNVGLGSASFKKNVSLGTYLPVATFPRPPYLPHSREFLKRSAPAITWYARICSCMVLTTSVSPGSRLHPRLLHIIIPSRRYRKWQIQLLPQYCDIVNRSLVDSAWQQDTALPIRNRQLLHHLRSLATPALAD